MKNFYEFLDFHPYDFQKELIDKLSNDEQILIYSARQMGISTILAMWSLWKITNVEHFQIGYFCPNISMTNFVMEINMIF